MFLQYNEITLREFEESDIDNKIHWINDPINNKYLHYDIPLEFEKTLNWYRNKNNQTRLDLVIEYNSVPVGLIGLLNIDKINNKAEYYICLGETQYKGKGIAKIATQLLVSYGFYNIGLNKIYLNVDSENTVACKLYEKSGFLCEGEFKKDLVHRGKYIDRKRYAILRENFTQKI
jgi:RimJ/RimL family protein N-acetyltransferase